MRRLFVPPGFLATPEVRIAGPDFHHLVHVLRVRPGEVLVLLDGEDEASEVEVISIDKRELTARITGPAPLPPHPQIHVTIAQAPGKGDRFEQVLQHCTEVGASEFIPLLTARTTVKLESNTEKVERWRNIVKGAAEQSAQARIPTVHPPRILGEILRMQGQLVMLDPSGMKLPSALSESGNVEEYRWILLVGPEGGFTPEEIQSARDSGAAIVSLGPFILRTETAALAALSQIMLWPDLRARDDSAVRVR